jgi:hypothetical protein
MRRWRTACGFVGFERCDVGTCAGTVMARAMHAQAPMRTLIGVLVLGFAAGCSSGGGSGGDASAGGRTGGTGAQDSGGMSTGGVATGGASGSSGTSGGGACPDGGCQSFTSSYPGDVWQAETHVAVGTNGYAVAAWIASDGSVDQWASSAQYIGYAFSTDSGATWTPPQRIQSPHASHRAFDPRVAVDAANKFYVAFETIDKAYTEVHVYVASAPAGTTTFGTPSEVTDPAESAPIDGGTALYGYDRPWIAVTKNQEIVVAYLRFDDACGFWPSPAGCVANVMLSRSTNGKSWKRVQVTHNAVARDGGAGGGTHDLFMLAAFPCASTTTNRLWLTYGVADATVWDPPNKASGAFGVMLQYSDDDGATWSTSDATTIAPITTTGIFDDPSCAGDSDDVSVAYALRTPGATLANSIQVVRSVDGGKTFGAPIDAQDPTASSLSRHPTIVREASGNLDIVYYGGDQEGAMGAVYAVHSAAGAMNWGKATLIQKPVYLSSAEISNLWLGDYLGVTTGSGWLYTTFTDNSKSGLQKIDFARLAVP